jgi:hypothetical protein
MVASTSAADEPANLTVALTRISLGPDAWFVIADHFLYAIVEY